MLQLHYPAETASIILKHPEWEVKVYKDSQHRFHCAEMCVLSEEDKQMSSEYSSVYQKSIL